MSKAVTIEFVEEMEFDETKAKAGTARWDDSYSHLHFICPCGCGRYVALPVKPLEKGWEWNGSKERPTLRPSIRMLTKCQWHGYLTDGVFTSC